MVGIGAVARAVMFAAGILGAVGAVVVRSVLGPRGPFYLYENYPTNCVTLHYGGCGFCNDGRGRRGERATVNGHWSGPYSTLAAAEASAKRTGRPWRTHGCV